MSPLDGSYSYFYDGTGVTVFLIDTRVRLTHFFGRLTCGFNYFNETEICDDDFHGHGTDKPKLYY
jgi:hypothetical protein